MLLYWFSSFIVLYLTFLNDYSGPVELVRTFFKNHKGPCKRTQHCWAQHVASDCMEPQQCWHLLALVAYSLKPVKLLGPCKQTQHCWPKTSNNTQQCRDLLRLFAWALSVYTDKAISSTNCDSGIPPTHLG